MPEEPEVSEIPAKQIKHVTLMIEEHEGTNRIKVGGMIVLPETEEYEAERKDMNKEEVLEVIKTVLDHIEPKSKIISPYGGR